MTREIDAWVNATFEIDVTVYVTRPHPDGKHRHGKHRHHQHRPETPDEDGREIDALLAALDAKDQPEPAPTDQVPDEPEPAFESPKAPGTSRQPTLRPGDHGSDGWVEYLQELLLDHGFRVAQTGVYDPPTVAAVFAFQKAKHLKQDGTCGNQTWAALREARPEDAGSDGRAPHSYHEGGMEARWTFEDEHGLYTADIDELSLLISSVGDQKIDAGKATVRITPPGGKQAVVTQAIGPAVRDNDQGATHRFKLASFRKRFPSVPADAPITAYKLEAYLEQELGGDFWEGTAHLPGQ